MKGFLKTFFAAFLALAVFVVLFVLIIIGIVVSKSGDEKPAIGSNGVLVVDLSTAYNDKSKDNTLNSVLGDGPSVLPGLNDVVSMLRYAKKDSAIKGIYIKSDYNNNSFAATEELRLALTDFKTSGKFVIAYGDVITQGAYKVASVADKVYCNPKGGVEWRGYANSLMFMKGLLDRLEVQPEVFYAGKFKSAT
jgi:protease-4